MTITTQRTDTDRQIQNAMTEAEWTDLLYEMALEVSRYGATPHFGGDPMILTISEVLSVDIPLNERELVDRVAFVRRADALGTLTAQKRHLAKQFSTNTQPPTPATSQGASASDPTGRGAVDELLRLWRQSTAGSDPE